MAYKFQLGTAKLSGSVQLTDGSIDNSDVNDSTAANIVAQIDDGEVAHTKVALENGDILIGDANGFSQNQTMSGDATLSAAGVLTIANDAVTAAKIDILDDSLAATDTHILVADGTDFSNVALSGDATIANNGALTIANDAVDNNKLANIARGSIKVGGTSNAPTDLDAKTSGQILVGDGTDVVSVAVSGDATLSAAGALTIAASAVEGSMINSNAAGSGLGYSSNALNVDAAQTVISSIYNTGLVVGYNAAGAHINFSTDNEIQFDIDNTATMNLSANGISVEQGGIQVPAGADIDSAGAGASSLFASAGANNLTIGGSTSTVVIPGNLTVSGTTVEIDAAFIVTSSVQFEGITPDGNEISLTSADPTADRTITLPDLDGHIPLIAGAIGNANVTSDEFLLLDGGTSPGTTAFADGHGLMHNAGGTMRQTTALTFASYLLPKITGGDVEVSSGGVATIQAAAVESTMLNANVISGQTDIGGAIASDDEFLISDGGVLRRTDMSRLATYVGNNLAETVQTQNSDAALSSSAGLIVLAQSSSTAYGLRLEPAADSSGKIFKIKRADGQNVTIECDGSETIDGASSILLESEYAAVMVFSDGSNYFVI